MTRKLKYAVFASALLWPFLAAALVACWFQLPLARPEHPRTGPYDAEHNWVGQGMLAVLGNALLLFVVVYTAKFFIGRVPVRWVRVYFFGLLIAASLPYIWLLLCVDWRNPHVFPVACWVHDPIGFWFVPTLSFAADTATMRRTGIVWYVIRSCIELVLIVPWVLVWIVCSFFCLGGGWI